MTSQVLRHPSLQEQATEKLIELTASGELPIGYLHSTDSAADIMGCTRTPVREAVIMLQGMGLATIQRSKGFIIERVSAKVITDTMEFCHPIRRVAARGLFSLPETGGLNSHRTNLLGALGLIRAIAEPYDNTVPQDELLVTDANLQQSLLLDAGTSDYLRLPITVFGIRRRLYHSENPLGQAGRETLADSSLTLASSLVEALDFDAADVSLARYHSTELELLAS